MKVRVEKRDRAELDKMGVFGWPVWTKEKSEFDWTYDEKEQCYFLEGRVTVRTPKGDVRIGPGDFVTFPEGLKCIWRIEEPVKKHYCFG